MNSTVRRKTARWLLLAALLILVVIQFVPVDRSNPPVEGNVPAPPTARGILRTACYDCHSNETVWPWYSHVAPVSWLVAHDVRKGREVLNFSTWNRLTTQQQARKLKESWEEVAEREMPPWLYMSLHRDAALSAEDLTTLRNWMTSGSTETGTSSED